MDTNELNRAIAEKLTFVEATQLVGDTFSANIRDEAPTRLTPLYINRTQKRRNRIISKVQKYMTDNPALSIQSAVDEVKDFAGGRFLVHYISDVSPLHQYLCKVINGHSDVALDGDCNDCTYNSRDSGFRCLTQRTMFKIQPRVWFPFEIQIMTFLAHDWDQKQHVVYEYTSQIPETVQAIFRGLSTRLLDVDTSFDTVRYLVEGFVSPDNEN